MRYFVCLIPQFGEQKLSKKKLAKFAENKLFTNLFQPTMLELRDEPHYLRGNWQNMFFKNKNPIILELGCGRGEYTIGQAKLFPKKNFIGLDVKGSRMYHGLKLAAEESLTNVAFVRTKVDFVQEVFANEISEIWIPFPDPFPNKPRRILTSNKFLKKYRLILSKNGLIHLKTDSEQVYERTLETLLDENIAVINQTEDYYSWEHSALLPQIQTRYEKRFLQEGKKIFYLSFSLS